MEKRGVILVVTYEAVARALCGGRLESSQPLDFSTVPEVVGVTDCFEDGLLWVKVHHPSLPVVPAGAPYPWIEMWVPPESSGAMLCDLSSVQGGT